jgi:hypothetical protein
VGFVFVLTVPPLHSSQPTLATRSLKVTLDASACRCTIPLRPSSSLKEREGRETSAEHLLFETSDECTVQVCIYVSIIPDCIPPTPLHYTKPEGYGLCHCLTIAPTPISTPTI